MDLFGASSKEKLVAIFDITSSSIGAALFVHHPDKIPEILTTLRLDTDISLVLNFQKFQRNTIKAFERAIKFLRKKIPPVWHKPDSVIIIFSSPMYVSQSKIIKAGKTKPFEIDEIFFEKAVSDEANAFKKEWQTRQDKGNEETVEILEKEIMRTRLNGYAVKNPVGKRAKNVEIFLYLSLGVKILKEKIKEHIFYHLGETKLHFQTFPFVAFNVLGRIFGFEKNFLFIDIGGEITDLISIRGGFLEEVISFPRGENFLVRRISSAFHFGLEESSSLLSQFSRGDLHRDISDKTRKVVEDASSEWCQFFKKSLEELPDAALKSRQIMVLGGRSAMVLKDYTECLKDSISTQFLLPEAFRDHFYFKKGFSEHKDISLILETLFADYTI
jgi:hypothetical protein